MGFVQITAPTSKTNTYAVGFVFTAVGASDGAVKWLFDNTMLQLIGVDTNLVVQFVFLQEGPAVIQLASTVSGSLPPAQKFLWGVAKVAPNCPGPQGQVGPEARKKRKKQCLSTMKAGCDPINPPQLITTDAILGDHPTPPTPPTPPTEATQAGCFVKKAMPPDGGNFNDGGDFFEPDPRDNSDGSEGAQVAGAGGNDGGVTSTDDDYDAGDDGAYPDDTAGPPTDTGMPKDDCGCNTKPPKPEEDNGGEDDDSDDGSTDGSNNDMPDEGGDVCIERTPNSISVGPDFQLTVLSPTTRIPFLGGNLDLTAYRQNGARTSKFSSLPVGVGGGMGAQVGVNRQIYYAYPPVMFTIPGDFSALLTQGNGAQAAFTYFAYDGAGNELWATNPELSNVLTHRLSDHSWLEFDGSENYYEYDSKGYLYRQTAINGGQVYYDYDLNYRVRRIRGDYPSPTYYGYDPNGNLSQIYQQPPTSELARTWYFEYQSVGTAGPALAKITGPTGLISYFGYDSAGRVVLEVDPYQSATYYQYDATGKLNRMISATGAMTTYNQTVPNGELTKLLEQPGAATYYTHSGLFPKITSVSKPSQPTSCYWGYDASGNQTTGVDQLLRVAYFAYDSSHNLIRKVDPLGNVSYFAWDNNRRVLHSQDELVRVTYFAYDSFGNKIRELDALKQPSYWAYNRGGIRAKQLDPRGNASYYGYDAFGHRLQTLDALGNVSYYGYDSYSNQTRTVSPRWAEDGVLSNWTSYYVYDLLSRQIQATDALGNPIIQGYGLRTDALPVLKTRLVSGTW